MSHLRPAGRSQARLSLSYLSSFRGPAQFTKQKRYFYDPDPIRVALGHEKRGVLRRDTNRTERFYSNPMGRNAGSVWLIPPSNYRGDHAAAMPEELVRRCLLVSCPENSLVLDCFGGVATVALVAKELGHRAITIEINPAYVREGRERLAGA